MQDVTHSQPAATTHIPKHLEYFNPERFWSQCTGLDSKVIKAAHHALEIRRERLNSPNSLNNTVSKGAPKNNEVVTQAPQASKGLSRGQLLALVRAARGKKAEKRCKLSKAEMLENLEKALDKYTAKMIEDQSTNCLKYFEDCRTRENEKGIELSENEAVTKWLDFERFFFDKKIWNVFDTFFDEQVYMDQTVNKAIKGEYVEKRVDKFSKKLEVCFSKARQKKPSVQSPTSHIDMIFPPLDLD